jgi:hypothetical protein
LRRPKPHSTTTPTRVTRTANRAPDPRDALTPAERCQAAARILALGIRRLLARTSPPATAAGEPSPSEKPSDQLSSSGRESPCL